MDTLRKKALYLSYFTVIYNVFEGIASIFIGGGVGSIALIGFGIDSFVESLSGTIMIWRFSPTHKDSEQEHKKEQKAIRLISYAFLILAAYVLLDSIWKLYMHEIAKPTLLGIAIAVISLIVMPLLFYLKYKTGKEMKSKSFVGDSKQTLACCLLSVALLISLTLNYFFGIWQADPIGGMVIAGFLFKEGYTMHKEKDLCC